MKLERAHEFTIEEAVARLQALTNYWDTKYGTRTNWQGAGAHIKGKVRGVDIDGHFTIEEQRLVADVKVGFLAEKMGGRTYVERKLAEYLDPKKSLEQLRSAR